MNYILDCTFDIRESYLYMYEIDHETEKCYYTGKNTGRVRKEDMNKVIFRHSKDGSYWGEIYVATYSKPEDVQDGIDRINMIRSEYLMKVANDLVTKEGV